MLTRSATIPRSPHTLTHPPPLLCGTTQALHLGTAEFGMRNATAPSASRKAVSVRYVTRGARRRRARRRGVCRPQQRRACTRARAGRSRRRGPALGGP
eukprot:5211680-Prymnesium_polylepis.1